MDWSIFLSAIGVAAIVLSAVGAYFWGVFVIAEIIDFYSGVLSGLFGAFFGVIVPLSAAFALFVATPR